ncbi:hypothetical protein FJT64_026436 [Amphibalanus amphitrite]|uniref:Uncharacterized protein n=1 Tax=Amphibalanus amphitrite TaxID=1232801 RepID=A0A6A4WC56_AMPAM|nr:hypothetical protein FJT64_026436 [Amphibalanus amphitrite]
MASSTVRWSPLAPLSVLLLLLLVLSTAMASSHVCPKKHGSVAFIKCDLCVRRCLSHHRGRRDSQEDESSGTTSSDATVGDRALCPFRLKLREFGDISVQEAEAAFDDGERHCRGLGSACTPLTIDVTYPVEGRIETDAVTVGFVCATASPDGVTKGVREPSLGGRRPRRTLVHSGRRQGASAGTEHRRHRHGLH